jgi:hypothetical protein
MSSIIDAKTFVINFHRERGFGGFSLDSVAGVMVEYLNANGGGGDYSEEFKKIKEEFEEFKRDNDKLAVKFDEAQKKISELEKENKELNDEIKSLKIKKKQEQSKTE